MATPKTLNNDPTARHAHRPSIAIDEMTDTCPLCGQKVTKKEYTRIVKEIEISGAAAG